MRSNYVVVFSHDNDTPVDHLNRDHSGMQKKVKINDSNNNPDFWYFEDKRQKNS
jgi:hypothetical protein